jgi:hypothetical protein
MHRYAVIGPRTIKVEVKTKKLWVKQYFFGAINIIDVAFELKRY